MQQGAEQTRHHLTNTKNTQYLQYLRERERERERESQDLSVDHIPQRLPQINKASVDKRIVTPT